jgi:hypothetical protein
MVHATIVSRLPAETRFKTATAHDKEKLREGQLARDHYNANGVSGGISFSF